MASNTYRYRLLSSQAVTPTIRELRLAPTAASLPYRAGQYVLLCDTRHRLPPRSYSVANAPHVDGQITLLVTRFHAGPVSGWVHDELRPGDEVLLTGPYGTFTASTHTQRPVLLLAAGSGLAPIRALAEALLAADPNRQITLFFSVRSRTDTIDHSHFEQWTREHSSFRYLLTVTRDPTAPRHQRIPQSLASTQRDLRGFEVFVAGPSGFVTDCAAAARALGAQPGALYTEAFFADPEPWIERPPATSAMMGVQR